jgi:Carboxypeptidase regulatory-like domain
VNAGAAVATDGSTLDGLYLYTSNQRQAAAKVLYQRVYDEAHNKAGFWGTLFTDAPDDVANQLCNTFASDWSDDDAKNSDAWKHTGPANAVSPDNMMFWDSPAAGNQGQFRSLYGWFEEAFYRPGTYTSVPIYRWVHVETRGTLTGTVVANADVSGANVALLGSGIQDVVVRSDGRFRFDNVPAGYYTISAGLNINGFFNTAQVAVHIDAGKTTDVTLPLQPPPEVNRQVTISVEMTTDWKSVFAHSPRYYNDTKSVRLSPFNSRDFLGFDGSSDVSQHGNVIFDIRLNADLSITVAWTAQEIDDEVEGEIRGGLTIAKDGASDEGSRRTNEHDLASA